MEAGTTERRRAVGGVLSKGWEGKQQRTLSAPEATQAEKAGGDMSWQGRGARRDVTEWMGQGRGNRQGEEESPMHVGMQGKERHGKV